VTLVVDRSGDVRAVYDEAIDLATIGPPPVRRAGHVEPDEHGFWFADLRPLDGPVLGPYGLRSAALAAEVAWVETHWLSHSVDTFVGIDRK
jgi:hypothetical protein